MKHFTVLRHVYQVLLRWAEHRLAPLILCIVSMAESIFFPIPPDVMMAPMMLAKPKRAFYYATICLASSVVGGIIAYFIGQLFFDTIGQYLITLYKAEHIFIMVQNYFALYGWWLIFIAAFTPIPYKIITLTSGFLGLSLPLFIIASIIGRGLRFYMLACVFYIGGAYIKNIIDSYFTLLCYALIIVTLLVGIMLWYI